MASSLHLLLSDRGKMLELRDCRYLWQPSNLPRLRPASFRDFLDEMPRCGIEISRAHRADDESKEGL
jgi:hypothetical protein